MATAIDTARFILAQMDIDSGDTISNLKLQKLLYYSQGIHLALKGKSLFSDDIEAWRHGPVIPNVYHRFKHYSSKAIPLEEAKPKRNESGLSPSEKAVVREVYKAYGQFSAWALREKTHREEPWLKASKISNGKITKKSLKEFFTKQIA